MPTSAPDREPIGTFTFGEFELDTERFELRRGGAPIVVQPQVLSTLAYLLAHRTRVVTRDELVQGPWRGIAVSESAISQVVFLIRKALDDDGAAQRFVKTVRGRGFRFVGDAMFVPASGEGAAAPQKVTASPRGGRFVGRAAELDVLVERFADAADGRGALVMVAGEPGIGKTRLVEEVVVRCHELGARVHWGRCREGGGGAPFEPWAQALRSIVGGMREGVLAIAPALYPMFPELAHECAPTPASGEGKEARQRLFEAVGALLGRAASEAPLLVVIEDVHDADEASLRLLDFIAARVAERCVLIVATVREPAATAPELHARARVTLAGLPFDDVAALAGLRFGAALPDGVLRALFERSSGNPFLLDELVRQLVLAGGRDDAGRALDAFRLPEGLGEALRRGIATLPAPARTLLAAASVLGRELDLVLLRETTGRGAAEVLADLEPALARRFIVETGLGRFRFAHSLVREAVYEALAPSERAQLHARAGAALEAIYPAAPPVSELAHHYLQAAPAGHAAKALRYAQLAAAAAVDRLAYEEAVLRLGRALDVLALAAPDEALRIDLLLELGYAAYLGGHGARALESFVAALEGARACGDMARFARAVDGYAAAQKHVLDGRLTGWLEEAVAKLPTIDSALGARLLARLAYALRFGADPTRSDELARKAVALARAHGDQTTLAVALNALRWGLRVQDDPVARLALSREAVATALAVGDRSLACEARVMVLSDLLELGRREDFDVELARYGDDAAALREPLHAMTVERLRVVVALLEGRFADADTGAAAVLAEGRRIGDQFAEVHYWIEMSVLRRERGALRDIEPFVRAMVRLIPAGSAFPCSLCMVLAEAGELDEARALLARYTDDPHAIPHSMNYWISLSHLADGCAQLGDSERAALLYARLEPHRAYGIIGPGCSVYVGPTEYFLGLLALAMGGAELAVEHFTAAVGLCERLGAAGCRARAELGAARAWIARGDRARSIEWARAALATAISTGSTAVAAQVRALWAEVDREP